MNGLVGVLGGMGPLATLDFFQKMIAATPAQCDQEHVPVIISSIPQIPDRTQAYLGQGPSPLPALVECGQRLITAGAKLIVIPCNTAHLWFADIEAALQIPMLHIADAALEQVKAPANQTPAVGLLATQATIESGLYTNRAQETGHPVQWLLPTTQEMETLVMPGIRAVKAGNLMLGQDLLAAAGRALELRGATALIMGCTEIPLVLPNSGLEIALIDATDALARGAVAWSTARRGR